APHGEVMQDGRTSDLVFGPAECVAYISTIVTLQPGDVISTGTPSGIGDARTPPIYLRPGQVVRTVVEGIGELVNRCVTDGDER
ncbi:MAG: fumarylacetoacetate hydrolase family protein, partial [Acidimicrobiia bacterium]